MKHPIFKTGPSLLRRFATESQKRPPTNRRIWFGIITLLIAYILLLAAFITHQLTPGLHRYPVWPREHVIVPEPEKQSIPKELYEHDLK